MYFLFDALRIDRLLGKANPALSLRNLPRMRYKLLEAALKQSKNWETT